MNKFALCAGLMVAVASIGLVAASVMPVSDTGVIALILSDGMAVTGLAAAPFGMSLRQSMPSVNVAGLMAGRPSAVVGSVYGDGGLDPKKVEQLLQEVKQELTRVGDEVKSTADKALKQSEEAGDASKEVKQKADELLVAQKKLTDAQDKLTDKLEMLETRNLDLEQKLANIRDQGTSDDDRSFGRLAAEHDEMRAYAKNGCRGAVRVSIDVKQAITSIKPGGGGLIWSDRETEIVGLPRRRMTIRNLLMPGRTGSNAVDYAKQTVRTNNAAVVSEGVEKPESDYKWDQATANVRTIAHFVHVSRQAMEDADQLQGEIDGELRYGLMLNEELQLLKGDGTGINLSGLVTEATAYAAAFPVTGETMIDTLRLALLQASLAEYPADGIVLHPTDWARVELTKDGEFRYVFANVMQMAGPQLWGRPVVDTQSMDEDEFLVGAFRGAATIYDRMDPEVVASSEDRDNFVKNMITVRAEERLALAIKRPEALITGDFGNVSG